MNDVDVVVIGGGPAGCTAAAMAAKSGRRVLLLDATTHPRAHVGESLLPGITPILADIGALADVQREGFALKTGSTHLQWGLTPRWDLWFSDSDAYERSWFVERDRFDAIVFAAAQRLGVQTRSRAAVTDLHWRGERLLGVTWRDAQGQTHQTSADVVVDASGAAAVIARDRQWLTPIEGMAHQALWAHFRDGHHLPTPREHQAIFVAEPDHWWWCFPLRNGRTSIGLVELGVDAPRGGSAHFDAALARCSTLHNLLGPGARRDGPVRRERDWSYRVDPIAGPGYRLVGDAAGFIDPVLSTGVFLAMHSAWDAVRSLDETDPKAKDGAGYATRHRAQFDDLLRMVCFYYRQNLPADDYFWESKRIVVDSAGPLSPRKAFLVLTSGLVANLALDDATIAARAKRQTIAEGPATTAPLGDADGPSTFVCVHLRVPLGDADPAAIYDPGPDATAAGFPAPDRASLYILIEANDPAAPAMARSRQFSIDVVAPRLDNDPLSFPTAAPVVRSFAALVQTLDDGRHHLDGFWRAHHRAIADWCERLDPPIAHIRTFGE